MRSMHEGRFEVVEGSQLSGLDECLERSANEYVFFSHTLCPYAERVWLTLLESKCAFTMVQIDLSNKPAWYLRDVNPRGLVPAVLYKGQVMTESLDICRWVRGEDIRENALISDAVSSCLDAVSGSDSRFWGIGRKIQKSQVQRLEASLDALIPEQSNGPFLFGEEQVALSDLVLYPFVQRAYLAMKDSYRIDIACLCNGRVGVWIDRMKQLPSVRIASADEMLLTQAFQKHKSLDFFDYSPYGPYDLHPHL